MTTVLTTIQAITDEHGATTHVVKFGKAMFVFESVALADQIKAELDAAVDAAISEIVHGMVDGFGRAAALGVGKFDGASVLQFVVDSGRALAHARAWRCA